MFDVEEFILSVYFYGLTLPITVYIFIRYDLYEITGFGRDNVETVFDLILIMMTTGALFFVVLVGVGLAMLVPIILVSFLYQIFNSNDGDK